MLKAAARETPGGLAWLDREGQGGEVGGNGHLFLKRAEALIAGVDVREEHENSREGLGDAV